MPFRRFRGYFFFFFFFFLISRVYVYIYKCLFAFFKIKKKKKSVSFDVPDFALSPFPDALTVFGCRFGLTGRDPAARVGGRAGAIRGVWRTFDAVVV